MQLTNVEPNGTERATTQVTPAHAEMTDDTDDDVVSTRLYERVGKTSFAVVGRAPMANEFKY